MFKSLYCSSFALKPLLKLLLNRSHSLTLLTVSLNSRAFTASSLYIPLPLFPPLSLSLCSVTKHKQILCRLLAPNEASAVWNSPQRTLCWVSSTHRSQPVGQARVVGSVVIPVPTRTKAIQDLVLLGTQKNNREPRTVFFFWSILKRTLQ